MFSKVQVCLIMCITTPGFSNNDNFNKDLVLQLDPNEIVETFKTVISSRYIREMANQMANKAAMHFINKIKKKEKLKQISLNKNGSTRHVAPLKELEKQGSPLVKTEKMLMKVQIGGSTEYPPPQAKLFQALHQYREVENKVLLPVNQQNGAGQNIKQHQDYVQPQLNQANMKPKQNGGHDKNLLDENVAFALLKDPSPDGDDWELESLEMNEIRNDIPVVEVKKINGVYFRRLLDILLS